MKINITKRGCLCAAAVSLLSFAAMAEGYQVNTLSTRQLGMGHTGFALKLGAESQFFNPAGMAFMNSKVEADASFNAIMPTATATVGGKEYKTDCDPSTPFSVFGAFSIFDNLKAGISVYTPYGSSINWTDNWPGATLNQSVKLATYTVQPTVAWRILPNLSVGAGLTLTWGTVDLHKGLLSGEQLDQMLQLLAPQLQLPSFRDITPASAQLTGHAGIACGVNLGVMYDITRNVTAGVNFRTKSMMKVKAGKANVEYAVTEPTIQGMLAQRLDGLSKTEFTAEMPLPAVLGFGAAWHNDRWTADIDAQLTFWSAYKSLDIKFKGASDLDQHLAKNYHNSWLVRGGVEWKATKRFDVRAGLMVDFSPCDKEFYNPETPGMTKIEPTLGFTFNPTSYLGVNVGVMYVAGLGVDDASYTTENIITKQPVTFTADYKLHSFTASLGVSLKF
ncbi:MAG: outer membrane protein transport protein [Muribaculaceae bacterium]|nr:outer membrane protein transport protein [Muribaculaceae bacterium]MDE6754907.1 outer membrane protein transport protein [Muribaculaceae bacterium]